MEVVSPLLADMRIDVNKQHIEDCTPFFKACENGREEIVALLLPDPRSILIPQLMTLCTPLWFASQNGHLSIVQLILASGREVDTTTKSIAGASGCNNTAAEIARYEGIRGKTEGGSEEDYTRKKKNGPFIAALIDSLDAEPAKTRKQLRELPRIRDPFIGDLFALVVFLCDELLTVSPKSPSLKAARFFRIALFLPMELQMLMCNRVFGSGKDHVLTKHSEPAFKGLGRLLAAVE